MGFNSAFKGLIIHTRLSSRTETTGLILPQY